MTIHVDPLPPRDAIAALEARGRRLAPTFAWQDAWEADHAAMFTVAKSAGFDILDDIYRALLAALSEGRTFADFGRDLTPVLQAKGWWGRQLVTDPASGDVVPAQLGSARRLQTIFDANMRVSYASGHWANFERNKVARPFLRYVCLLDDRTRPAHRARHNLVLPVDHSYWDRWAPPCGWNCRCTLQSLNQRDIDRLIAEGEDLVFDPPADTERTYVNSRTGEVTRVPDGIDPGWAYNAGKAGWKSASPLPMPPPPARQAGANIRTLDTRNAADDIVARILGGASAAEAADYLKRMVRDLPGPIDMAMDTRVGDVRVAFHGSDWFARRTFSRWGNELRVSHDYFTIEPGGQGAGLATTLLANSVDAYRSLRVSQVAVHADIDVGGYAWAKFGFVPGDASWDDLRHSLREGLWRVDDPAARQRIAQLLDDDDPRAIWELSDSQAGKTLLLGSDWHGALDLDDPLAMARFMAYIRRSRSKL